MQNSGKNFSSLMPKSISNTHASKCLDLVLVVISNKVILTLMAPSILNMLEGVYPLIQGIFIQTIWKLILQGFKVPMVTFSVKDKVMEKRIHVINLACREYAG